MRYIFWKLRLQCKYGFHKNFTTRHSRSDFWICSYMHLVSVFLWNETLSTSWNIKHNIFSKKKRVTSFKFVKSKVEDVDFFSSLLWLTVCPFSSALCDVLFQNFNTRESLEDERGFPYLLRRSSQYLFSWPHDAICNLILINGINFRLELRVKATSWFAVR